LQKKKNWSPMYFFLYKWSECFVNRKKLIISIFCSKWDHLYIHICRMKWSLSTTHLIFKRKKKRIATKRKRNINYKERKKERENFIAALSVSVYCYLVLEKENFVLFDVLFDHLEVYLKVDYSWHWKSHPYAHFANSLTLLSHLFVVLKQNKIKY
jgi:hypothetical protein